MMGYGSRTMVVTYVGSFDETEDKVRHNSIYDEKSHVGLAETTHRGWLHNLLNVHAFDDIRVRYIPFRQTPPS